MAAVAKYITGSMNPTLRIILSDSQKLYLYRILSSRCCKHEIKLDAKR